MTPPGRAAHTFSYQGGDLEQDYTPPAVDANGTGHVLTSYDLDQNVTSVAPDGTASIVPGYDSVNGRLLTLGYSAGTNSYTYIPATGRVASITAPDGNKLTYTYDGQLLRTTTFSGGPVTGTITRTYDADFRLATETVTGGQSITFGYDNDSLLTSAGALTITRSPTTGFVTGTTLGGITDSRTYDAFGHEQTYSVSFGTTSLYSVDSGTRDPLGRIVTKTETVLSEQHVYGYTYDARGRLTDVTKDGAALSHYDYDANGNRLATPALTSAPTYDAQDRLQTYGNCSYSYKSDGSLQTKSCPDGVTTYDYDSFENLRGVTLPGGTAIGYLIDGQNRRIGKKVNGALAEGFLYRSQLQPAAWLNGDGSVRAAFVYGLSANVPEYVVKGGTTLRLVTDQVGSVRLVVDSTGNVAERIDYDEFGNVLSDSAPGIQPFGFAGGLRDLDTGLTRLGTRDYDPMTGRWMSKDPIGFEGGDTDLYNYVAGDPVNYSDEDGQKTHARRRHGRDRTGVDRPCGTSFDAATCTRAPIPPPPACQRRPNGTFGFDVTFDFTVHREFKMSPDAPSGDLPSGSTLSQHEQKHVDDYWNGMRDATLNRAVPSDNFPDPPSCNAARATCARDIQTYIDQLTRESHRRWDIHP